jgi:mono/diheme cytochrome c family protein
MARERGEMKLPQACRANFDEGGGPYRGTLACTGFALAAFIILTVPALRAQSKTQEDEKASATPAGNAETGKKIFTKDGCYECHGREGQGAAQGAGPRIGPPQLSLEAFGKYVHQPTGQMPPYTAKVLSDQDVADIYAYLQSRPKAKPSKDIPLLNE